MAEPTSYQGGSIFLRWWPPFLLVFAVIAFRLSGFQAMQWPALLILGAYVHFRWLPWQFTITGDGLALTFPFGRHAFIPRMATTVRIETVGATALVGPRRRFGYLLLDSILFQPGRSVMLRTAFTGLGYDLKEEPD
jgi:hypothetical protein